VYCTLGLFLACSLPSQTSNQRSEWILDKISLIQQSKFFEQLNPQLLLNQICAIEGIRVVGLFSSVSINSFTSTLSNLSQNSN